jgi:uncharacterized delta-60 repeat protein
MASPDSLLSFATPCVEVLESRRLLSQYSLVDSFGDHGTAAAQFKDGEHFQQNLIVQSSDQSTLIAGVMFFPYSVDPGFTGTGRVVMVRYAADGRIIRQWASTLDIASIDDLVIQEDGKIIMLGGRLASGSPDIVARFTTSGALDSTFVGDGVLDLNFDVYPEYYEPMDLALDPEGRILLMGRIGRQVAPYADRWSIARLTPSGEFDPSFGEGGIARMDGQAPQQIDAQPDGKILAMTSTGLMRFTTLGDLDSTFGDNGIATFPQLLNYGRTMTMLPDGRILLNAMDKLARITRNGRLDTTFGAGGIASVLEDVAPQNPKSFVAVDGSITVVDVYAVDKLTAEGQHDPSFGISGRLNNYTEGNRDTFTGIVPSGGGNFVLASNGDVLMSGYCNDPGARLARFQPQFDVYLNNRGVLSITGTDYGDIITIKQAGETLHVVYNGAAQDLALSDVTGVDIICGDGDDKISFEAAPGATFFTGPGDDTIFGGSGNDHLDAGSGHNVVYAGAGNDTIVGGPDGELLDGGEGNDRFMNGLVQPTVGDTIYGGEGDDSLIDRSSSVARLIHCGAGADTIWLGSGNDTVYGDDGNDNLMTFAGDDLVFGGRGHDTILSDEGRDTLWGGIGNDWIRGGDGDDLINGGQGKDRLWGNAGDDHLYGRRSNDALDGGSGDDVLVGGEGIDKYFGQDGNDSIFALDNNQETLDGGVGSDRCEADDLLDILLRMENWT